MERLLAWAGVVTQNKQRTKTLTKKEKFLIVFISYGLLKKEIVLLIILL